MYTRRSHLFMRGSVSCSLLFELLFSISAQFTYPIVLCRWDLDLWRIERCSLGSRTLHIIFLFTFNLYSSSTHLLIDPLEEALEFSCLLLFTCSLEVLTFVSLIRLYPFGLLVDRLRLDQLLLLLLGFTLLSCSDLRYQIRCWAKSVYISFGYRHLFKCSVIIAVALCIVFLSRLRCV